MKRKKKQKNINYEKITNRRFLVFFIITTILFIILGIKMVNIMVINQKQYTSKLNQLTYSTVSGTSSPRGRIYDRNYNILVDNKSLKNITYQKQKHTSNKDMIEVAKKIAPHIDIDYSRLTDRSKREYFFVINKELCDTYVTKKEIDKVKQRKMTQTELNELKLSRIPEDKLEFPEEEKKLAYLFYLMNKGYTYEEKIIKSDATDEEYAYVSENNDLLTGFNTRIDWERVYPYGDTLKSILGTVSTSTQGIPAELKDYYLDKSDFAY